MFRQHLLIVGATTGRSRRPPPSQCLHGVNCNGGKEHNSSNRGKPIGGIDFGNKNIGTTHSITITWKFYETSSLVLQSQKSSTKHQRGPQKLERGHTYDAYVVGRGLTPQAMGSCVLDQSEILPPKADLIPQKAILIPQKAVLVPQKAVLIPQKADLSRSVWASSSQEISQEEKKNHAPIRRLLQQ